MKKVEAVVRTSRFDEIITRLRLIGTTGMTVTEVHGMSRSTVTVSVIQGQRMHRLSAPRYQIMMVVRDEDAAHVAAAIVRAGATDAPGDGIVTISDILAAVRIRTNETGVDAL